MCQSFKANCVCGQKTAEIFFGKMVLAENSVAQVYCPICSQDIDTERNDRVWDNDWILEFDMNVLHTHAASMGIAPQEVTAEWVFDQGLRHLGRNHSRMILKEEIRSALKSTSFPKPICRPTTRQ